MTLDRPTGISVPELLRQDHLLKDVRAKAQIKIPQLHGFQPESKSSGENRACTGTANHVKAIAKRLPIASELIKLLLDQYQGLGRNQSAQTASINGQKPPGP